MSNRSIAALTAAGLLALATPLIAGPPWIAVEMPANPHHPSTRGAAFLVHAYHHSEYISVPVSGTIEGLVDGKRRSLPLQLTATNRPGVYAVRGEIPRQGTWIAVVSLTEGPESSAHAVVRLDREGRVAAVDVPSERTRDGWTVPRPLRSGEIDSALRDAARMAALEDRARQGGALAGFGLLGALVIIGVRRSRRSA